MKINVNYSENRPIIDMNFTSGDSYVVLEEMEIYCD